MRIACVQNGDYTAALSSRLDGGAETYNGQFYTVDAFRTFVGDYPHLVVSLDAKPHEVVRGSATLMAIAEPRRILGIPRRITLKRHAAGIIDALEEFGATHLLVRCCDVIACELMAWANRRQVKTAAIVAAQFSPTHGPCRRFCELANAANVLFVANHNRVATQTLIDCGLNPSKAIAWDLPPAATPQQYAVKQRELGSPLKLVFAGALREEKGVTDLVVAVKHSRKASVDMTLTICGSGPLLGRLLQDEGNQQGWLCVTGQVPVTDVIQRMDQCDAVVVPSRSSFAEGLPFVIQEALAVRSPLVLSDHPVFVRYFREGNAVRFFREGDANSLEKVLRELAADVEVCRRLSERTEGVWAELQCPLKFADMLERLSVEWGMSAAIAQVA
jgi:glycosyltransferase involved in cell wall biosynthesis